MHRVPMHPGCLRQIIGQGDLPDQVRQKCAVCRRTLVGVAHAYVITDNENLYGNLIQAAQEITRRGGTLVLTSAAPVTQRDVQIDLFTFAMSGKRIQGTLYGSTNSQNDIPLIADLYRQGKYMLDELITRTYSLDDINTAFTDMKDGKNIRGVIIYD